MHPERRNETFPKGLQNSDCGSRLRHSSIHRLSLLHGSDSSNGEKCEKYRYLNQQALARSKKARDQNCGICGECSFYLPIAEKLLK